MLDAVEAEVDRAQRAVAQDFIIVIDNHRIFNSQTVVTLPPETRVGGVYQDPLLVGG